VTKVHGSKPTSIAQRLNSRLQTNPAWRETFEAVAKVIDDRVTQPRNQLATIRDTRKFRRGDWVPDGNGNHVIVNSVHIGDGTNSDPDVVHFQLRGEDKPYQFALSGGSDKERDVLMAQARFHGFGFFSGKITNSDYARIAEWVEHYWPEGGTESFARFIGFVKGMHIEADQLWAEETSGSEAARVLERIEVQANRDLPVHDTEDRYPTLEPYDGEIPIHLGGTYYPTSHVQLRYDAISTINASIVVDPTELFHLFYYIAPIHLVFSRLVAEIVSPPVFVDRYPPQVSLSLYSHAALHLDAAFDQLGKAPKIST
jgi:hypothetical protein